MTDINVDELGSTRALAVLPCRRPEPFPRPTRAGAYDG
jgi:hypothetical protein